MIRSECIEKYYTNREYTIPCAKFIVEQVIKLDHMVYIDLKVLYFVVTPTSAKELMDYTKVIEMQVKRYFNFKSFVRFYHPYKDWVILKWAI
jgi:hypothetical protein